MLRDYRDNMLTPTRMSTSERSICVQNGYEIEALEMQTVKPGAIHFENVCLPYISGVVESNTRHHHDIEISSSDRLHRTPPYPRIRAVAHLPQDHCRKHREAQPSCFKSVDCCRFAVDQAWVGCGEARASFYPAVYPPSEMLQLCNNDDDINEVAVGC